MILENNPDNSERLQDLVNFIETVNTEVYHRNKEEKPKIKEITAGDYQKTLATVSQTAHDISDYVNNKIGVFKSRLLMLIHKTPQDNPLTPKLAQLLEKVEYSQKLLNDLKAIKDGVKIRPKQFQIVDLFSPWLDTPQLEQAHIQLDIKNGQQMFYGDMAKIQSFISELIENALKHNSEKNDLTICLHSSNRENTSTDILPKKRRKLAEAKEYWYIRISDNGKGVSAEKKESIFLPLQSSDKNSTGLGLFIIQKTIEKMQGHIKEVGHQGCVFELFIPYIGRK